MACKYSKDNSINTVDNLPMFAAARRHWHAKQKQPRSFTSSNSISSIVSNVTTHQQEYHNHEYTDIRSILSEEYPYDYE